jgi:serine/threonine protein kinase
MLPSISDDPRFEQMFLDEARIASRIRHPNVVEILDLGEQDDVLYLVMEWVDGEPLSLVRHTAVERGPFPLPIALKIVSDACAGLHAAHEVVDEDGKTVGLVHRDVSPQNILVGYEGVVKLVDFGVAKTAGRTAETTNEGQVKGKPPYMSPEHALGKPVDRRTDLFALGIVLYQLVTGRHPMRGETDVATLHNIVSNQPVLLPSLFNSAIPMQLERVTMKALARDPKQRFQTARDFELALEDVANESLPRVRAEEVGRFVHELLGAHGEERRAALRESIRLADERVLAVRHRATEDEVTSIGVNNPMFNSEEESGTYSDIPERHRSMGQVASDRTLADLPTSARRLAPWSLWMGVALGLILGVAAYWAVTSKTDKRPKGTLSVAPLEIPAAPATGTAPPWSSSSLLSSQDVGQQSTTSVQVQAVSGRHPATKTAGGATSHRGVGRFGPPPVSNPGF